MKLIYLVFCVLKTVLPFPNSYSTQTKYCTLTSAGKTLLVYGNYCQKLLTDH